MFTVHMVSRNKDNQGLANYHKREKAFLWDGIKDISTEWQAFVNEGVIGETSRLYRSLNERDMEKTNKSLLRFLTNHPDYPTYKLPTKLVALANLDENANGKLWLWDVDETGDRLYYFINLLPIGALYSIKPTLNGFAVVTRHFKPYQVLNKIAKMNLNVTWKKDSYKLITWAIK